MNQLTKAEMKIDDELQALLLLSSLPKSWDTLVVTLSNSAPDGKLTTDTVTDSVLNEEARRKERGSSSYSEANVFESRGRTDNRGSDQRGQDKPRGRSKSRSRISCYYCGKPGHKKDVCRILKRDQRAGTVRPDAIDPRKEAEERTAAVVMKSGSELYFIGEDNYHNSTYDSSSWIIDSGASYHVTPHEGFFSTYRPKWRLRHRQDGKPGIK